MLVDSESFANRVLCELLTEYGLPIDHEESVATFQGRSLQRVREVVEPRLGTPLPVSFEAEYHRRLFGRLDRELTPVEGVKEALRKIPIPKCVASSGTRERIQRTLELVGLWEQFREAAFSGDDVERGKPAPDLFLHAARHMGVEPERCAVVEDTGAGIEAANAAGMTSFGYAGSTPRERLLSATGAVFETMEQLPGLLLGA